MHALSDKFALLSSHLATLAAIQFSVACKE